MTETPQRHFVIAIYGVGNPAPGDVERSLRATLDTVASGVPVEVHEVDWNAVAVHAPRGTGRLWKYARHFSRSFAAAAWHRPLHLTPGDRVRMGIDAIAHVVWAASQSLFALFVMVAALLFLIEAVTSLFSHWVRVIALLGIVPPGVGLRAAQLRGEVLDFSVFILGYGGLLTASCFVVSLLAALLESVFRQSLKPIAVTARRYVLVVLLVPCTLLSLSFTNEEERPLFGKDYVEGLLAWTVIGLVVVTVMTTFLGGFQSTLKWALLPLTVVTAFSAVALVMKVLRGRVGRAWLGPAKVLLDIALYVGSPVYRTAIQDHLSRIVAAISDRSTTAIWVVAHSLGSVIALDSLVNSPAWQSSDRVRLVTLGSPIRRFFFRFFPGASFEPRIDAAACTVARRVGEFTWLNAYRRFDYVGKSLRLSGYGLDLPTGQNWPAHANYWADARVAHIVFSALPHSRPVQVSDGAPMASGATEAGVPDFLSEVFKYAAFVLAGALLLAGAAATGRVVLPGVRELIARSGLELRDPAATIAAVRHERSWVGNGRMHEFRIEFQDETGRVRREVVSVPGSFGLVSDPRFDYLALARFVRTRCVPERALRFYQFGWSVPCSRSDVPMAYDREDPTRFQMVGLEYRPGFFARSARRGLAVMLGLLFFLTLLVLIIVVPLAWVRLWGIFVGDPDMLPRAMGNSDE